VMGYDDEARIADTMVPALTTMALPLREIGRAAMTTLLDTIEGVSGRDTAETNVETMVPCRLVIRESTGPAPTR